jgi:hypothetical protein
MDIFSFREKSNNCFASLIKTYYATYKPITDPDFIVKRPGIKISVFGETEGTKVTFFIQSNILIHRKRRNVEMNL